MPGQTAGGLPYPHPTEPVRDGATGITNLAQALESRGHGKRVEARTVNVATNAAGGWGLSWARPFTGDVAVSVTCWNAGSGYVPVTALLNVDNAGCAGVAANAMNGQAVAVGMNVYYVATGEDSAI